MLCTGEFHHCTSVRLRNYLESVNLVGAVVHIFDDRVLEVVGPQIINTHV
jgi:hypothetical protein